MLSDLLLSRVPESLREVLDTPGLDPLLESLVASAESAWPEFSLERSVFVAYLGDRLNEHDGHEALARLQNVDLYLACACCLGDPAAIAQFESGYLAPVAPALVKFARSGVDVDDILQSTRTKLLTAPADELPKIAVYRGMGSLQGWVRTSAVRLALTRAKKTGHKEAELSEEFVAADDEGPELNVLRDRFKQPFKDAFQKAMGELTHKQRNLLRMTVIDGVALSQLAELHGIHRATASKWICQARDRLAELTKRNLQEALGAQWSEVDSIIQLVRSRIDVSIHRILADGELGEI